MLRTAATNAFASASRARFAGAAPTLRSYATQAGGPANGGASNTPLVLGLLGLAGLGGYVYLNRNPEVKAKAEGSAKDAEAKAKQAADSVTGYLDPKSWKSLTLKEVKPYNHNTSTFVFELPAGQTAGTDVCSAVIVKGSEGSPSKDGKPVIRPYTPVSTPEAEGHIDLLIKKYKGGAMTEHIHSLKPGDKLEIKGPIPKWPYKPNEFEHIGLIGGGSGITPLWQLVQKIASNPDDKTKVTLIYANVTPNDILLKEKFDKVAAERPEQFKTIYAVDKGNWNWKGHTGYITSELLSKHLPLPGLADKTKIFVCGPPPQVEAICGNKVSPKDQGPLKGHIADLGYQPSQVYKF